MWHEVIIICSRYNQRGFSYFASSSQAPLQFLATQTNATLYRLFIVSGVKPGFDCSNVIFSGMSRDSGCSLIHPDPNEATTSVSFHLQWLEYYLQIYLQLHFAFS